MKLFKQLLNKEALASYIKMRAGKKLSPKSYRYRKKYKLSIDESLGITIPLKIHNLIGFARNHFASLCRNYTPGKFSYVWVKKEISADGPRSQRREPEEPDFFRKVLILNRADLLIHSVLADCIKTHLIENSDLKKTRSRIENIISTRNFIKYARVFLWWNVNGRYRSKEKSNNKSQTPNIKTCPLGDKYQLPKIKIANKISK